MNNNKVILFFCTLFLMVSGLTPRYSVIAQEFFGERVHDPDVARILLKNRQNLMGLLGVPTFQTGGYWQLVMIEQEPIVASYEGFQERDGMKYVCQRINTTWENGHVAQSVIWFQQKIPGNPNLNFCEPGNASFSFIWTPPPNIIYPDRDVDVIATITTNEYFESALSITGRRSIFAIHIGLQIGGISDTFWGDVWDSGRMSRGSKELICDVNQLNEPGSNNCEKTSFTVKPKFPEQGEWANRMEIQVRILGTPGYNNYMYTEPGIENLDFYNHIGSFTYIYEWVEGQAIVAAPTEQQEPHLQITDLPSFGQPEMIIPSPAPSDDGGLWEVVIGGMAILGVAAAGLTVVGVGAAAAILVARAKAKRPEIQQDKRDDQEIVGYILELSTNKVFLQEKRPETVRVTCWKVRASGAYGHAPEAAIAVQAPPTLSNITVSPLNGQGSMDVQFDLVGERNAETHQVVITASGGGERASATITVAVDPGVVLSLTTPENRNTLVPGEEEGLWACASLEPDPPNPNFESDLENSKIIFEVKGPNADWIDAGQEGENEHGKWVYLLARAPSPGATLAPGNPTLVAKYQMGNTWLVEELKLELQAEYALKLELFDVPKTSDITYNSSAGEWQASSLLVYWVNTKEGKTPVDPGFEYGFPDPPIQVDPPVLHVKSFVVQNEHLYLLKFEVDQDLQQHFGEDLTDNEGMVRLSVEALDSEGQSYTAEMDYQLRPSAITMHYYWTDQPGVCLEGEREHNGIALKPGELVAYEKDQLGVGAFLVRADQAEDFHTAYDQRLQIKGEPQATLRGEKSWAYLLKPEEEGEGMNRYAARLEAKEIEFYSRKEEPFEVQVEMSLDESRYPNYHKPYPPQVKIKIDPLHIFLKLWVFPGRQTGTSIAGAFMYVPSKGGALSDFALTLDIQSEGSRLTADQTVQQTDGDGLARWTLSYQGMNWNNYRSNFFTVRCGVPKPEGGFKGTQVQIDIGKNVDQFLADVYQQRKHRDLNLENPDFETGSGFFATVADFIWPDFLCGPVNNIVDMVTNNYNTYTCSNLVYRIIKWWGERRTGIKDFDENKITSMNGIDMGQYIMGLIPGAPHTFAGIFLANVDQLPTDDPRSIDPWWIQNWSKGFRQRVDGLYTNANQYTMQAGLYAALALLALLTLKFAAWWQGPEVAMALKTRIMGTIFGGGGSLAWAASQGITIYSDGHLQGKNYIKTIDFDYSYDSIPTACASLKQKGIPEVMPIVEW